MPRNSGGTYSLPESPVVADTVIDPDWANNTLNDIAAEMTDSLSRSGDGGMLAHMRGVDGSAALPAYSFTSQNTLGSYRSASGDYRIAFNGTDLFKFTTSENRSYSALKVSSGGCTIDAGGLTVTAGGLTVTAGGATITAGNLAVDAGAATISGAITTNAGTNALVLKPGSADHVYMSFNARTATPTTRSGYVGYGGAADTFLTIANEVTGGIIKMTGGTSSTATDPTNVLELTNGNLKLSGTAPNKDEALANTLTPANICKAWGTVSVDSGGTATLAAGFNITSVSDAGGSLTVTFAQDFASANYAVMANVYVSGTQGAQAYVSSKAAGSCVIRGLRGNDNTVVTGVAYVVDFTAFGAQ